MKHQPIHVIGGGLAGSEATWQIAQRGIPVILHEMRPVAMTPAHQTDSLAELVCSNSFRSDDHEMNAVGLLHYELRQMSSLILEAADANQVPAGSALAVDRHGFSAYVQDKLLSHPLVTLKREEVTKLDVEGAYTVVSTGPLTSKGLAEEIVRLTDKNQLAFFDAIAPIVYKDSIDFTKAWFQSRYDKGSGKDYINCPLTKDEYYAFVHAIAEGEKTDFKEWEKDTPYFEGCLPIEVMAARGPETLRYGPMKPVGLTNPHHTDKPYAVVQLRQDNKLGSLYNIVGFQTKLKYGAQAEIFKKIPGLENAEFARLGGIHRNSFIQSPELLDERLSLKAAPNIKFAGQITGVEGYVESTAVGLLAGIFMAEPSRQSPPETTALGALLRHITGGANPEVFQPMNINFGLFPEIQITGRKRDFNRKKAHTDRAKIDMQGWIDI